MQTMIICSPENKTEETILNLDLTMIKMKMMDNEDGLGWSYQECEIAEVEYKRFLILCYRYSFKSIVPTKIMDKMWHFHILDTRKYYSDCILIFGKILHHFPYLGMRGEEDKILLIKSFNETKIKYKLAFNEEMEKTFSYCDNGGGNCVSECSSEDS